MTVSATPIPRNQYTANGSDTEFTYNFEIASDEEIAVFVDDDPKTLITHYTVSGEHEENGGTVTFVTAPINGATVTLIRDEEFSRTTDLGAHAPFRSDDYNAEIDHIHRLLQQINESVNRALKLRATTTADPGVLTLPEPDADKFLRWDSEGEKITNVDIGTYLGTALAVPVTVPNGGTGADNATSARTNLGIGSIATHSMPAATGNTLRYARMNAGETSFEFRTPAQTATDISALTQGYHTVFVPVSACMDEPSNKPGDLAVYYNSTYGLFVPYREFSGSAFNQLGLPILFPKGAVGGQFRMRFYGYAAANNAAVMEFGYTLFAISNGVTITATTGINSATQAITGTPGNTSVTFVSDWTTATTLTGHVDGTYLAGRIFRNGDTDASAIAFRMIGVEIQYSMAAGNDA